VVAAAHDASCRDDAVDVGVVVVVAFGDYLGGISDYNAAADASDAAPCCYNPVHVYCYSPCCSAWVGGLRGAPWSGHSDCCNGEILLGIDVDGGVVGVVGKMIVVVVGICIICWD
jgi:hypothetical protein